MAKINLTIDKNYCSNWGVWAGLRELIQNAKDAEEYEGKAMEVTHYPKTFRLEIVTRGAYVEPANLLVLGRTSKGDGRQRGRFGEGFCLGVLSLVRKGLDVKFRNGDMSWTVSFESPDPGHPLEGQELLTFKSRQLQIREPDFRIEIEGVTTELWDAVRKMILFLEPPKAADVVQTDEGSLLLHPDHKGHVFVRGLFVKKFEDLACGYDLETVKLDRDRQMIDEWELHFQLGKLWNRASAERPDLLNPRVYEMAKQSVDDARQLKWHADDKLLAAVREQFTAENGEDAVPVTTNAEAKEVTGVGGKPAMVSGVLKELLEKGGLSVEGAKKRLEGAVEKRWLPNELLTEDPDAWAVMTRLERVAPQLAVVTFRGVTPACHLIDDEAIVGVDRRLLSGKFTDVLRKVVGLEAKRRRVEPLDVLLAYVAEEMGEAQEGASLESRGASPAPDVEFSF